MLRWIYFINALISVLCLMYYFEITSNKVNQKQLFVLVFTTVSNYAFALSVFADNFEGVYVAYQVYFAANLFATIVFMLVIAEFCGYKVSLWLRILLTAAGIILLITYGRAKGSSLYYKSMEYTKLYSTSALQRSYGPLHILLFIFVISIDLICVYYVIRSLIEKKDMSKRTITDLFIMLIGASMMYVVPKIFKVQIEVMPFIFTLIDLVVVRLFIKASMYDISSNLLNVFERRSEYGYVAVDTKYRYLGANPLAKEIFPNLSGIRIDSKLDNDDSIFCTQVIPWLNSWIQGDHSDKQVTTLSKTVSCSVNEIKNGPRVTGYLIEVRDVTQNQKYITLINNYNQKLQKEVKLKTVKILEIQDSIITGMATMVESRDNSTGGHIKRTSAGVRVFLEYLKEANVYPEITTEFCIHVAKAAPMHDLGKIAVDDAILRKPGKFTDDEYLQMQKHSKEGAKIVEQVLMNVDDLDFKEIGINVAHYHHERWDGKGYPAGLKGKEIPLEARIMAFADVFDALVSKRCYKDAFSYDKAFSIMKENLGTQFDPELGTHFLKCRPALESLYMSFEE